MTARPRDLAGTEITVACCQVRLVVGEPDRNRAAVLAAAETAARGGARVVVVPELATSGYVFRDGAEAAALAEPLDGRTVSGWVDLAGRHGIVLVGGLAERGSDQQPDQRPDRRLYNTAVLVDGGGVRAAYRKAHLWDREKLIFTPGSEPPPVVSTRYGRLAVMVCYDLAFPEWVRLAALPRPDSEAGPGAAGADLVCVPANWPAGARPAGERPVEAVRAQAAAAVNRVFVAVGDRTGAERGVDWVGGSLIAGPDGWLLAGPGPSGAGGGEGIVAARLRPADARRKALGPGNDVHADRRPELYGGLTRRTEPCR